MVSIAKIIIYMCQNSEGAQVNRLDSFSVTAVIFKTNSLLTEESRCNTWQRMQEKPLKYCVSNVSKRFGVFNVCNEVLAWGSRDAFRSTEAIKSIQTRGSGQTCKNTTE